jgi:hypothetical protein
VAADRVVLHLSWTLGDVNETALLAATPLFFEYPDILVLVLEPEAAEAQEKPPHLLEALIKFRKGRRNVYKVVGTEKIAPEHLGLDNRPDDDEAYISAIRAAAAALQVDLPQVQLEFLSTAQWETEAGPYAAAPWEAA